LGNSREGFLVTFIEAALVPHVVEVFGGMILE